MTRTPEEIKKGLECCDEQMNCDGCPYHGEDDCSYLILKDALAHIEKLKAQIPRWISVEERLPERGVFVCVYYGNFIGNLMDVYMWDSECWRSSTGYLEDAENITHWMPLPEPPEELEAKKE